MSKPADATVTVMWRNWPLPAARSAVLRRISAAARPVRVPPERAVKRGG